MSAAFKATLEVKTPIHMDSRLTLDALLSWGVFIETGDIGADTIPRIPLDYDDRYGVLAGSSVFLPVRHRIVKWSRSSGLRGECDFSTEAYAPNGKRPIGEYTYLKQDSGPYKRQNSLYDAVFTREIYFFGRGDIRGVERLLGYVNGIGVGASAGAGEVGDVTVEPIDDDFSIVLPNGTPARPVPAFSWDSSRPHGLGVSAIVPPYFGSEKVLCALPKDWTC